MNLQELYKKHGSAVYRLALHYVQNSEDAQEITQDVFVAVFEHMSDFRGEAQISTWIHRITINKSLDFLRHRKRKKRFASVFSIFTQNQEAIEIPHFDHPGILLESQEEMKIIFDAINQLPEQQKTALILMKLENLSQQEAAEIMKISTKAVESLISRAKQKLKELLAKENK